MLRMWSPNFGTALKVGGASFWCLLWLLPTLGQAQTQDLCPPAATTSLVGFNLNKTQACVNEQISISNASPSFANVTYYFAYDRKGIPPAGSGQTLPTGTTATKTVYNGPGVYTILQTGSANGTGFTYCQTVEIVDTPPVSFAVTSCGNRTASVTITLNAQTSKYDRFNIDWGDGTVDTKTRAEVQAGTFSHQYSGQLTYFPVKVQGVYDNGGCPDVGSTRYVTVSGSSRPAVNSLTTNADGTISISYQGTSDPVNLQLKDAGGSYKPTGQSATTGSFKITTNTSQVQCFKLVTASTCAGVPEQASDEVCSLVLNAQIAPAQNTLTWNAYTGTTPVFTQYQLNRNTTTVATPTARNTTTFTDVFNFQCGVAYCYTLKATLQGQTTTTITSAPVCVTGTNSTGTASQKPTVTALKTNADGTITISYQSNDPIELQQKDGSGVYKPTGTTGLNGTLTVSTNTSQVQCFKVVTKSPCATAQESEEVCSVVLDAKAISRENDLSWQTYSGTTPTFVRYRIYRDGAPVASINTKNTTAYADQANIECNVTYCYTLETTVRGTTETVITSAPVCITGINTTPPAALSTVFVTIENGAVRVQAVGQTTSTSQYKLTISRANAAAGPFDPIGTVENSLLFIDNTANTNQQSYCYQMAYQNGCGVTSPASPPVCTVWLASKTATGIDWSADSPFTPGSVANYILETLDTENNTTTFLDLSGNTHFDPDLNDPNAQRYRYRIVAYDNTGTPSYSNYYEFRQEARLYVPNAFTPNGDGANDTFVVKGVFVDQFDLTIYSRWGEAVFHATDPNTTWDGSLNGQPAPAGEYAYRLAIVDMTGQRVVKSGPILLIR